MVATFKVNSNRDLYLADGKNLVFAHNQDAMGLVLMHRCLMRVTENIYDIADGIDYFGTIFNQSPDAISFQSQLTDRILQTEGVISIKQFNMDITQDQLNYDIQVVTRYGDIYLNRVVS